MIYIRFWLLTQIQCCKPRYSRGSLVLKWTTIQLQNKHPWWGNSETGIPSTTKNHVLLIKNSKNYLFTRGCQSWMKNYLTSTFFAEIRWRLITSSLAKRSSPTLTTPKCILISKSYLCYKQMNPPPKCRATSLDKIIWTKSCN